MYIHTIQARHPEYELLTLNCFINIISKWVDFLLLWRISTESVFEFVVSSGNCRESKRNQSCGTVNSQSVVNLRPGTKETIIMQSLVCEPVVWNFLQPVPNQSLFLYWHCKMSKYSLVIKTNIATVEFGIGSRTTWTMKIVCLHGQSDYFVIKHVISGARNKSSFRFETSNCEKEWACGNIA